MQRRVPAQGISHVERSGQILPGEVKTSQVLHPTGLPTVERRNTLQERKGLMISFQNEGPAFQIAAPLLQSVQDSKQFLFPGSVTGFSARKLLTRERNGAAFLQQNRTRAVQGGISNHLNAERQ